MTVSSSDLAKITNALLYAVSVPAPPGYDTHLWRLSVASGQDYHELHDRFRCGDRTVLDARTFVKRATFGMGVGQ